MHLAGCWGYTLGCFCSGRCCCLVRRYQRCPYKSQEIGEEVFGTEGKIYAPKLSPALKGCFFSNLHLIHRVVRGCLRNIGRDLKWHEIVLGNHLLSVIFLIPYFTLLVKISNVQQRFLPSNVKADSHLYTSSPQWETECQQGCLLGVLDGYRKSVYGL